MNDLLKASNARLKDIRRLSRRPERSERRLFLADGPKAVEAALEAGCVEEVFARADVELSDLPEGRPGDPGREPRP